MPLVDMKDFENRQLALLRKHMITAQAVRNRLNSALNGDPLTAQEIIDGVRLSHEEYLDLVERAVQNQTNR